MSTAIANHLYEYEGIKNHDLSSIRDISYGGLGVTKDVDRNLPELFPNVELCYSYGSTEMGLAIRRFGRPEKLASPGKTWENYQIKIADVDSGKTLGINEEGEICIKSPYMMLKYHKDPESTEKAIDADGWYHTADLGYYDADGDFYVVDRMKELIKYKQLMRVSPWVIEEVILKHPDVTEVGVVAKPDLIDSELPMAFITTRAGSKVSEEEISKHVEDNLPDHMRLRGGVKILEKMPTTPSGKISKKLLREMAKAISS